MMIRQCAICFCGLSILGASLDPSIETVVTVAQGIAGLPHTLEISGGPDTPVTAVRVYRPALATRSE